MPVPTAGDAGHGSRATAGKTILHLGVRMKPRTLSRLSLPPLKSVYHPAS